MSPEDLYLGAISCA